MFTFNSRSLTIQRGPMMQQLTHLRFKISLKLSRAVWMSPRFRPLLISNPLAFCDPVSLLSGKSLATRQRTTLSARRFIAVVAIGRTCGTRR